MLHTHPQDKTLLPQGQTSCLVKSQYRFSLELDIYLSIHWLCLSFGKVLTNSKYFLGYITSEMFDIFSVYVHY